MPFKSYREELQKLQLIKSNADEIPEEVLKELGITREDVEKIAKTFHGRLSFKGTPGYDQDVKVNPLYGERPNLIAFCANWKDVRVMLQLSHQYKWNVTCRSGGHSTAGYSLNNCVVIDMSLINDVVIDPMTMQMTVGAGANWGKINAILDVYQLHVPGGVCSTVGVAGYMQGGGYGFTSRELGMNCDSVLEVTVMLETGAIVIANEKKNSDLFWAIRGGTGGNFGILLQIKYRLYPLYKLWGFVLQWPLVNASSALMEIQADYMKGYNNPKLNYQIAIAALDDDHDNKRALVMMGMYDGTPDEGKSVLTSLLNTPGVTMTFHSTGTYYNLSDVLFNGLNPPKPILRELKRSGYISKMLSLSEWDSLIQCFSKAQNKYNLIGIEPYGGAINDTTIKNAFIHRDVYMDLFIDSFFDDNGEITSKPEAIKWLNEIMDTTAPFFNGHVYQNYPVRNFSNFRWAYWGDAYNSLLFVKNKYDREDFFKFEQSISPYPPCDNSITRSDVASMFTNTEIEYEPYSFEYIE